MRRPSFISILLLLPASFGCGGSEKAPSDGGQTALKPVVRYSRSGDAAARRVIAEAALGRKTGGAAQVKKPAVKALVSGGREEEQPVSEAPPVESREKPGGETVRGKSRQTSPPAAAGPKAGLEKPAVKPAVKPKTPAEKAGILLKGLTGSSATARKAYIALWKVDKEQLPALLVQVASKTPTNIRELDVLVLQKDFARYDEKEQRWFYWIKGMGNFELDDIAMSKVARPRGAVRVRLKKFRGFPLGVVLRAGLLNRFRSTRFPGIDDRKFLSQWWNLYYRQNAAALK